MTAAGVLRQGRASSIQAFIIGMPARTPLDLVTFMVAADGRE